MCSIHFAENAFVMKSGRRYLRPEAVPTKEIVRICPEFQADQTQTKPFKQNPTPGDESGDDQVDEDDSIYERDVSPIRTDDEAEVRVPEGSSRRHEGCRCDVCHGSIIGFRYACVECANFDLCAACEARGHHATHYVLRVPAGKLNSDVQAVIKKIREDLLKVDKPEEGIIEEHSIKIEMKEEDLKQEDPLQETVELSIEQLQDAGSQNDQFLTPNERGEEPFTEVPLTHQSKLLQLLSQKPRVTSQQPAMSLALSHGPQVLSHQPAVLSHQSQVLSHKPAVLCHQLAVLSHQPRAQSKVKSDVKPKSPEVLSHQPQVRSHQLAVPRVLSHRPAVPQVSSQQPQALSHESQVPQAKTQEERYLMIEVQGAGTVGTVGTTGTTGTSGTSGAGGSYAVYTHRAHPARIHQQEGKHFGEPTSAALASAGEESSKPTKKKRKK